MSTSTFLLGYAFCGLCAVTVIAGDTLIKHGADQGHTMTSPALLAGAALYAAAAVFWFLTMRVMPLGQAGLVFGMVTLIALAGIGATLFGERLALREVLGIGCALLAMGLMARVV